MKKPKIKRTKMKKESSTKKEKYLGNAIIQKNVISNAELHVGITETEAPLLRIILRNQNI